MEQNIHLSEGRPPRLIRVSALILAAAPGCLAPRTTWSWCW
jgi:hypothetical protein